MAIIRLYYDKTGKIIRSEHRVDEIYSDENASMDNLDGIKWMSIDIQKLEGKCVDDFEIKNKKLVKRKDI
ncbi:MAG: hypothetical protein N3I35_13845 [Clostridia bacterium]|nr:hypothetical protein [Clostridia bacterium]